MQNTARRLKIVVSADGPGVVSCAGTLLLTETARVTGLDRCLSAGLMRWRPARAVHDPGKVIAGLAVMLAIGGGCLAGVAALRAEPQLFGPVASDPVVSRLVSRLAADAPRALAALRSARAAARQRAWELAGDAAPGADGGLITVDIDATIVTACSEKDQAAPTWKKTFGLLTEPPDVFSQFSRCVSGVLATVRAHGRWGAVPGRGGADGPADGRVAGDG
ncbi:MAG: transposase [Candidatus Dormibacteria bacterium]